MTHVQKFNYVPNTLRKNRTQAYENDIEKVFSTFNVLLKTVIVEQVTVADFGAIWASLHMQYIFQCLCEEQSEDQFAQLMYEVILKKYFRFKDKNNKVFAIFALYFTHFACEERKRINISPDYLIELKNFLLMNRNDNQSHYMKVAYELHLKCFNVCTKIGLPNPIVRANGEVPRKPILVKTDPLTVCEEIENEFKEGKNSVSIKETLQSYDRLKNEVFKDANYNKDKFPLDVHFSTRVNKLLKNYKQFVIEKTRKKQEDED